MPDFNWTPDLNYGSLDQYLYGYEATPDYNEYGDAGDLGAPESQWIPGAMDYLSGKAPMFGVDQEMLWSPLFDNDTYNMLSETYGGKNASFGTQKDGRWKRDIVYDASGNPIWTGTPRYQVPTNFWKDFALPAVSMMAGAGALGPLGGLGDLIKGGLAVNNLASGNELGGLAQLAGLGGFNDIAQGLSLANSVKNKDVLGLVSQGAEMTGLSDWFSNMFSNGANDGGDFSLDIGQYGQGVFDQPNPGLTGSEGVMLGATPGYESLQSVMGSFGNSAGMLSPDMSGMGETYSPSYNFNTPTLSSSGEGSLMDSLPEDFRKVLKGAFTPRGFNTMKGLAQLYAGYKGSNQASKMLSGLSSLYAPNSAYAQQLRKQLARQDAASGRRSQYGPREVELQAKLAQLASGQIGAMNSLASREAMARNAMLQGGLGTLEGLFGG